MGVQTLNRDLDLTWPIGGGAGQILSRYGLDSSHHPHIQQEPSVLVKLALALYDDADEMRRRARTELT